VGRGCDSDIGPVMRFPHHHDRLLVPGGASRLGGVGLVATFPTPNPQSVESLQMTGEWGFSISYLPGRPGV